MFEVFVARLNIDYPELEDLTYFNLHIMVDKDHGETLIVIGEELDKLPGNRIEIQRGVDETIQIIGEFWDMIYDIDV